MKRILLGGLLLLLIIIASYFFWQKYWASKGSALYRTDKVRLGNIVQTVSANGTLNPVILVNVGAQITGKVQKIYADFNDRVESGQVLLELDSSLLKTEVEQSEAALEKSRAGLDLAIANAKRGESLYKENFVSKQEWDQLSQAEKSARAELALAKANLDEVRTNLNYATIRSPVSGVVVDRRVDVGQTVTSSFQTPILFQIAQDLRKMQIDTSFAEADIGNIIPGQPAVFTVDAFPQRSFLGVVRQIRLAPTVQQNVVTYNVVVVVENKDGTLLPGMTAYVNIKTAEHKNVLLVPNAALRFKPKNVDAKNNGKQASKAGKVYKLVGDVLQPISCGLGIANNSHTEVLSGELKLGDTLVVSYAPENQTTSSFRLRMF